MNSKVQLVMFGFHLVVQLDNNVHFLSNTMNDYIFLGRILNADVTVNSL